jgi:alpha-tubulin suppressor-like RCC1 family protein
VVVGGQHTCVRLDTGRARCWGASGFGQLGLGSTDTVGDDELPSTVPALALDQIAKLGAGYFHSCALHQDGDVRCWGDAQYAQLGQGDGLPAPIGDDETLAALAPIELGGPAIEIATGYFHSCALLDDQQVRCWGAGTDGQLGYGNTASIGDDELPSSVGPVELGGAVTQLTAGFFHSCARLEGGEIRCWGGNGDGQLGYGNTVAIGDDETAGAVGAIELGGVALAVVAGGRHSCALLEGGDVRCWGLGASGQLGNGTGAAIGDDEAPGTMPVVDVGGTVVQLAAGFFYTCALLDTAEVRCWGFGGLGGLGYGNTDDIGDDELPSSVSPIDVGGDVIQIAASNDHTCALLDTGAVRCWGVGDNGRLGYGDVENLGDDEVPSVAGDVAFF